MAIRREPGEVTPAGPPCQHLFSTFRVAVATRPCPGFPYAEERFYAASRGPSTLFFNLRPIRFRVLDKRLRFPEAEELSSQPRPARQHFFFKLPVPPLRPGPASRFPVTRRGVSTPRYRDRQHLFFQPHPDTKKTRKRHPASAWENISTYPPRLCQHPFLENFRLPCDRFLVRLVQRLRRTARFSPFGLPWMRPKRTRARHRKAIAAHSPGHPPAPGQVGGCGQILPADDKEGGQ